MAYGNQVKTDSLSTTYTSEVYPLGSIYVEPADEVAANGSGVSTTTTFSLLQGERTWIFVKAGVAFKVGDLIAPNAYGTPFVGKPDIADNTVVQRLLGVADHVIALNSYGWIIARGTCVIAGTGSVILGSKLDSHGSTGTAGQVTVSTSTDSTVVGYAMEALSGTLTNYAQAYVDIS
jgi:hypothetical protein